MKELFDKWQKYFTNNPKGYWFKRKLYGWGWTPVRWQGWLVILIYVAVLVYSFKLVENREDSAIDIFTSFAPRFLAYSIALIYICYKKGEKPRWQWGEEKE